MDVCRTVFALVLNVSMASIAGNQCGNVHTGISRTRKETIEKETNLPPRTISLGVHFLLHQHGGRK